MSRTQTLKRLAIYGPTEVTSFVDNDAQEFLEGLQDEGLTRQIHICGLNLWDLTLEGWDSIGW